jgi:hypothetical protein
MDVDILKGTRNRSLFSNIGTFLQSKSEGVTALIVCHHFVLLWGNAPIDDHQ